MPTECKVIFEKLNSPTPFSIRGISVLDSSNAWLSGAKGSILRTVDGGNNWSLISPPDADSLDFRDVEAFSAAEAVIVSAGFPARIYRTENAGNTWKLVYENLDSAAFMNSVAFKNVSEGIVFGDQINGRHLLLKTNNGGKTWKLADTASIPKPLALENGFAASGSCIAIDENSHYYIGLGGEKIRVFSSTKGNKWNATPTLMKSGSNSSGIYSIASGDKIIMAVGGDYSKANEKHSAIISEGLGKTWEKTEGQLSGYRSVVDYSPYCDCWLSAGTNGVDVSFNNGKQWKKIDSLNINTLQFTKNGKFGYAANSSGELYRIQILKD